MKNNIKISLLILLIQIILYSNLYTYFNSKYEPPDNRVIHGLGQYVTVYYTDE